MKLEIRHWTSNQNMIIYSYFYFCKKNNKKFELIINEKVPYNAAILYYESYCIFLDYSDEINILDTPSKYNYYFKRSLKIEDFRDNILPLNFQVNLSYKSLEFLAHIKFNDLINKYNRIEIYRAFDYFNLFTNLSHKAMDIRNLPKSIKDNGGKIIYYSRLWNPNNHIDEDEKNRRNLQNDFRINACNIIKKNFKNSEVGILTDNFSIENCPKELLLSVSKTKKINYYKKLISSDIAISDDGLKDTPGWKIGEYLLFGKAVVTTPLNVILENFKENFNYEKLSTRSAYIELPDKIENLLCKKKYLEIGYNNLKWSEEYLHPNNYINRILSIVENKY